MADRGTSTAAEIVAAVHQGRLSVWESVTTALDEIDRLDPAIHAWVRLDHDGAMRQADELDECLSRGERLPLHGIPFAVKDIIDVAGLTTEAGFAPYRDRIAARDAEIVARLRRLGAIPLGKTHTTQFAFADPAPTSNPYRLTHTPGGSSSGSGAAVGAHMVPFALGTQTSGSVLRPAAFCGAVGLKPTFNWTSRAGVLPLAWSLDHLGLITRDMADTTLIFDALTGDGLTSAPLPEMPRIGLLSDFVEGAEPETAAHLRDVARCLRDTGAYVAEVQLPIDLDLILTVQRVIMLSEVAAIHAEQFARHREAYGPLISTEIEVAQLIPAAFDLKARRLRGKIRRELDSFMSVFDALLLPTVSVLPPARDAGSTGDPSFQAPWTMLGAPSISLPTGMSASGFPIGVQLVGHRGEDRTLLSIAAWCESKLGLIAPPGVVDESPR